MKLKSAESTTKIVKINETPYRVWEAITDSGIKCYLFVASIMVHEEQDQSEFERDLRELKAPSPEVEAIPSKLIL